MKRTIYTVQITQCSNKDLYWYHNRIGEKFECEKRDNDSMFWPTIEIYTTILPVGIMRYAGMQAERGNILPDDCQVVGYRTENEHSHLLN